MADMIPTAEMEYWLKTGVSTYTKLENLKDFSPKADKQTYERKYKDRVNTTEVVTGTKYQFEAEVELEESGVLHDFLESHEDMLNVATEIIRVKKFRPALPAWATILAYALGARIIAAGKVYECTVAGTSGVTAPIWPATGTVVDATVTWTYRSAATNIPVGTGYGARRAAFVLNVEPIDGAAGEFLAVKLTLAMADEVWVAGTFDVATSTFTPGA
jgi:hypothetical protein